MDDEGGVKKTNTITGAHGELYGNVLFIEYMNILTGSGTFLYLAYQTLKWGGTYYTRQKVTTGLVMTWAAR